MQRFKPFLMTHCGERTGLVPLAQVIIAPCANTALKLAEELTGYPSGVLAVQPEHEWRKQAQERVRNHA